MSAPSFFLRTIQSSCKLLIQKSISRSVMPSRIPPTKSSDFIEGNIVSMQLDFINQLPPDTVMNEMGSRVQSIFTTTYIDPSLTIRQQFPDPLSQQRKNAAAADLL